MRVAHAPALLAAALAGLVAESQSTPLPRVKHIVYLMMENRAFDHMLGWLPGVNGLNPGICNKHPNGTEYCVTANAKYVDPDPDHSVKGTAQQIYGNASAGLTPTGEHDPSLATMSGFVASYAHEAGDAGAGGIMDCFDAASLPVLSTLAQQFTLLDGYHSSVPASTYPNRLFAMSGTSYGYAGNDATLTLEGWPQTSVFKALEEAAGAGANGSNSSWRVYFSDAPTSLLLKYTRSEQALTHHRFVDSFYADAAKGDLPAFTWVDPAYVSLPGMAASDQHPAHDVTEGERFIKGVYEALRASPLWNETALIITYDEHGGFFDHVPPAVSGVPNPDGRPCADCSATPFEFTRLGIRVPTVIVSPWALKGAVVSAPPAAGSSGAVYEHSSLSATLAAFAAGYHRNDTNLTARDGWAAPLHGLWEDTPLTAPRTDCPATLPAPPPSTPSQLGKPHDGSGPVNALQRDMLLLVEGTYRQAVARRTGQTQVGALSLEPGAVTADLDAAGVYGSEGAAGRHMRARMAELLGHGPQ